MTARDWSRLAYLGIAALAGPPGSVALADVAMLSLDKLFDRLFAGLDATRRDRARTLGARVADALQRLAMASDPGTLEAARLKTETLLARFGLRDERLAAIGLDASRAAKEVLANATFSRDEELEIRPLCERLLTCFYASLVRDPALFAEMAPHSHQEQLRRLGELQTGQAAIQNDLAKVLAIVSAEKGVPLPVLREILARLGEADVAHDAATIETRLRAKAEEYVDLQTRLHRLTNDDPRVQELRRVAADLIAAADFDAADTRLAEAEALDLDVVEELEERTRQRRLSAAQTRAERAAAARLRLDYRAAAEHYRAAEATLPVEATEQRWEYAQGRAYALYSEGEERGDNATLVEAIAAYRAALTLAPRERVQLRWAMTQNNLGNALFRLGGRESGTARLEQGVAAYRAALEEQTRERVPLQWAMTQTNLGSALLRLGEHESGTARLEEAVAAYRAALEEWTRERVPLQWAATQTNLGTALTTLGERERGTARLEEAVAADRGALGVFEAAGATYYIDLARRNLATAHQLLDQRLAAR